MNKTLSIALFGGSFDPIHIGHIDLIEQAVSKCSFNKVIVLPCKQSPHKDNAPVASNQDRVNMCKIATAHILPVEVSDWEINNSSEYSYTWATVEYFRAQYRNANLFLILGTDQWDALHKWARYDYLKSELTFIVVKRQTDIKDRPDTKYIALDFDNPLSSTLLRNQLHKGQEPSGVTPDVYNYIISKGLYTI